MAWPTPWRIVAAFAVVGGSLGVYWWSQTMNTIVVDESEELMGTDTPVRTGKVVKPSQCFNHTGFGAATESVLEQGSWYFNSSDICDPSTVREFRLANDKCKLHRYTPEEVLRCLANKSIALVGDSIVRHQAVNIFIFLQSRLPTFPCGQTWTNTSVNRDPHQSNAWMIDHHLHYICGAQIRCNDIRKQQRDNMYYHDAEYNVNISYFGYFQAAFGHGPVGWYPNNMPFEEEVPLWWDVQLPELADAIKAHFQPFDEIVVNSGAWHNKAFEGGVEVAIQQLEKFNDLMLDPQRRKPTWETTTLTVSKEEDREFGTQAAHALGWKIFDRRAITKSMAAALEAMGQPLTMAWPDNAHFSGYPNQEMNNALYNLWCGSEEEVSHTR